MISTCPPTLHGLDDIHELRVRYPHLHLLPAPPVPRRTVTTSANCCLTAHTPFARHLHQKRLQEELKHDFRAKFRNVSRILNCVTCEKCRLWGKLQFLGVGTALKVRSEAVPGRALRVMMHGVTMCCMCPRACVLPGAVCGGGCCRCAGHHAVSERDCSHGQRTAPAVTLRVRCPGACVVSNCVVPNSAVPRPPPLRRLCPPSVVATPRTPVHALCSPLILIGVLPCGCLVMHRVCMVCGRPTTSACVIWKRRKPCGGAPGMLPSRYEPPDAMMRLCVGGDGGSAVHGVWCACALLSTGGRSVGHGVRMRTVQEATATACSRLPSQPACRHTPRSHLCRLDRRRY